MPNLAQMLSSRFLKQSDVPSPVLVTIVDLTNEVVERNTGDTKWCLRFREFDKPLVCNSTNLKRLAKILGSENTDHWIGKQAVLYVDPTIEFAGDIKGGLRLRAPAKRKQATAEEESEWAGAGIAEMESEQLPSLS